MFASNCAYNVLANRLGLPVQLAITTGNIQVCSEAIPLFEQLPVKPGTSILRDRVYGSKLIRDYLARKDVRYTIPPKKKVKHLWPYDTVVYKMSTQL